MGYVTKEETECKSCGRTIHKNELQYSSPEGGICLYCYTGKQPRQTTPLKETRRMPETIEGEKLLGCIRAEGSRGREVLAFTPNRVFVVGFPEGGIFGGGYGEDPVGVAMLVIDVLAGLHTRGKSDELLKADFEEFLKAGKNNLVIPNSEIREVELKNGGKWAKLNIITSKKKYERGDKIYVEYEWHVAGLIPEKKDVKIEDYENILRPIFGDKLSVKTRERKLKKKKEAKAWELEDQLTELKEQLGRGVITQEEYEQKEKLLEKSKE